MPVEETPSGFSFDNIHRNAMIEQMSKQQAVKEGMSGTKENVKENERRFQLLSF